MKQAIAGVAPPDLSEVTIMTVWPTITANPLGRALGRTYRSRAGFGPVLTVGKLMMVLSIPIAMGLFVLGLAPWSCRRYRLTNRRVIVQNKPRQVDERWIGLEEFDNIDVVVLPGQEWYPAGDLVFRKGKLETFRLAGVARPETFRQTCLKAQRAFVGVRKALEREALARQ
ncbi:MAG: PH domain-containing protein [Pirellulales bacterium]